MINLFNNDGNVSLVDGRLFHVSRGPWGGVDSSEIYDEVTITSLDGTQTIMVSGVEKSSPEKLSRLSADYNKCYQTTGGQSQ